MNPPFRWYGGKATLACHIVKLIESTQHQTYCEPFGGSAAVLFAKKPSPVEVYNDMDSRLVNFFRVLRNPETAAELHARAALTLYSREEFQHAVNLLETSTDPVKRAWAFFVVFRQSFGGGGPLTAWGYCVTKSARNRASSVSSHQNSVEAIPAAARRFARVQVEHDDFRKVIARYDRPETLFYVDPPYVMATRNDKSRQYQHELTDDDHRELVNILTGIQGGAIVSGYRSPIYDALDTAGFASIAIDHHTCINVVDSNAAARHRVETIWIKRGACEAPSLFNQGETKC